MTARSSVAFLIVAAACSGREPPPPSPAQTASAEDAGRSTPARPAVPPSPAAPVPEGSTAPLEARTYALLLIDDLLVRGGSVGVTVESVESPASPTLVGRAVLPGSVNGLADLGGGRVAAACGSEGVFVVALGGEGGVRSLGHLETEGAAWRLASFGDHVLLAEGHRGVAVLDLRRPERPRVLARWRSDGHVRHVRLAGEPDRRRAFVAEGRAGLSVLDLARPTGPTLLGRVEIGGEARAVDLRGETALVAAFHEGLVAVDVSDPGSMRVLGRLETPDSARDVLVVGARAFVAAGTEGVLLADVSSPAALREVTRLRTSAPAVRLARRENLLFVAVDSGGVEVYDVSAVDRPRRLEAAAE